MSHIDGTEELIKLYEDQVCGENAYLNDYDTCQPCALGCSHCESLGHCLSCKDNFEAVSGPDFGFCFPKCFHGMYRKTYFTDYKDFLTEIQVPVEEFEADSDMKLVIPPHIQMLTCHACPENCRGCFAGLDG